MESSPQVVTPTVMKALFICSSNYAEPLLQSKKDVDAMVALFKNQMKDFIVVEMYDK